MKKETEQEKQDVRKVNFEFCVGQLVYYEEAGTGKVVEGQIELMIFDGEHKVYKLFDDSPTPAELVNGRINELFLSAESGELSEYAKDKNALRLERQKEALAEAEANLAAQKAELQKLEGQVV